jgi:hypothetical protein
VTRPPPHPCPDEKDFRPWELPGGVRRDRVPHRSRFLLVLGIVALFLSIPTFPFFLPGLIGSALGAAVWHMANQDLRDMRRGLMDPDGEAATWDARMPAIAAVWIGGSLGVLTGLVWLMTFG